MRNNKMWTKVAAVLVAGAMVMGIGACGTSTTNSSTSAGAASSPAAASETAAASSTSVTSDAAESIAMNVDGGWDISSSEYSLDKHADAKNALDKALEGLNGADYEPVAYIGSQVVAGTNYCILCKITPVVPNATPSYALVYVYEDLDGNAEIIDTQDIEIGTNGGDVIGGADSALASAADAETSSAS